MSQRLLKFNMCSIVLSVLATPTFPFPLKKKKKASLFSLSYFGERHHHPSTWICQTLGHYPWYLLTLIDITSSFSITNSSLQPRISTFRYLLNLYTSFQLCCHRFLGSVIEHAIWARLPGLDFFPIAWYLCDLVKSLNSSKVHFPHCKDIYNL